MMWPYAYGVSRNGGSSLHQHLLHETPTRRGLPRWLLLAVGPLALALGLIAGVAVSAYWPAPATGPAPLEEPEVPPAPQAEAPGNSPSNPAPEDAPSPPGPSTPAESTPPVETAGLLPPPVDESAYDPDSAPWGGGAPQVEVRTLVDARTVLSTEFGAFSVDGVERFHVDYQLARDANYNTMLVGIVKIAEYNEWRTAVREHGDELERWLEAAARRVRPAAEKEGFGLSWTLFEVVSDRPYGFLASEVTEMPRGQGYLVTRPLAGVTDFAPTAVAIAAIDVGAGPVTTGTEPWSVYGPVLRFDPTDLYRPPSSGSR